MFLRFMSVGVVNTAIHWLSFALFVWFGCSQALANLMAFCLAVTFSFFVNARWTFGSQASAFRYMLYVGFMGTLATTVGWAADTTHLPALITLIGFSAISLVCGYAYSRFVVFKDRT